MQRLYDRFCTKNAARFRKSGTVTAWSANADRSTQTRSLVGFGCTRPLLPQVSVAVGFTSGGDGWVQEMVVAAGTEVNTGETWIVWVAAVLLPQALVAVHWRAIV